jgi:solute carrier family 25 (mitochondrial uncoupling protein), member 27
VAGRSPAAYRGLLATGVGIVKEEGFLRLYRGLTPACLRHCVYSGIRVGAYEFLREHVFLKVFLQFIWHVVGMRSI